MLDNRLFVLIGSPLVGPYTWQPVAEQMRSEGIAVVAPALPRADEVAPPYWQAHAEAIVAAVGPVADEGREIILVGHSGGGMLLPAVRRALGCPVAAYIFVDAGIPQDGMSRLDFFEAQEAADFRAAAVDGAVPVWAAEDLREVLPDAEARERFVSELLPMPLAVYEEPIPVFTGWPDAPCGYLQLSAFYDNCADQAIAAGWAYRNLGGGHFYMLIDPAAVGPALVESYTEALLQAQVASDAGAEGSKD